jgi:hypothetical protein
MAPLLTTLALLAAAPAAFAAISDVPTPHRHPISPVPDFSQMDHPFGQVLGHSFLFYEAQRSGNLSIMPDAAYRVPWRGNQLLQDGSDIQYDLTGGWYEAGSAFLAFRLPRSASGRRHLQSWYPCLSYKVNKCQPAHQLRHFAAVQDSLGPRGRTDQSSPSITASLVNAPR